MLSNLKVLNLQQLGYLIYKYTIGFKHILMSLLKWIVMSVFRVKHPQNQSIYACWHEKCKRLKKEEYVDANFDNSDVGDRWHMNYMTFLKEKLDNIINN
jgi:hypothetical protein